MFSIKEDFKLISFNARGLRDSVKRKAVFLFCKNKKSHIVLLQETHSIKTDEKFWSNQWGDKIIFGHGTNRSAGTAILLHNFPGKILTTRKGSDGHWIFCVLSIEHSFIILGNIYGHNNLTQNKELLSDINDIIKELKLTYPTDNVLLGGDFNMVCNEWLDRCPTKFVNHHYNPHLYNFCNLHNLIDPWRILHQDQKDFSWFKPDGSSRSRIDFWLISDCLKELVSDCSISAAPLSDHCLISLLLKPSNTVKRNRGYWKFNADLLNSEVFCTGIRSIIKDISEDDSFSSFTSKWEYIKFKIRNFSISFSKQLKHSTQLVENELLREIYLCCNKPTISDSDKRKLLNLQTKLDDFYTKKAKGAYIRSRAKWIEEGERNSAYFCRLERARQEKNNLETLLINGTECSDPKTIAKEVFTFFNSLYSSNFSPEAADTFFDKIKEYIPLISEDFKLSCDAPLSREELEKAMQCLIPDRSPGSDGLTANFYKHFWEDIKHILFYTLNEVIANLSLPHTMKQGVIVLIPKPGKDGKYLENWRPITLLNNDYKLLTHIFSNRLKNGLHQIISETQSGFMKGRSIHNNVRLVLDLLEYNNYLQDDGFILFLDFYKAFDTVEHFHFSGS